MNIIKESKKIRDVIEKYFYFSTDYYDGDHAVTNLDIQKIRDAISINMSEDFEYYLRKCSTRGPDFRDYDIWGAASSAPNDNFLENLNAAYDNGVPREIVPFIYDDGFYFCINEKGEVHVWYDHYEGESWPTLADFIEQELCTEEIN